MTVRAALALAMAVASAAGCKDPPATRAAEPPLPPSAGDAPRSIDAAVAAAAARTIVPCPADAAAVLAAAELVFAPLPVGTAAAAQCTALFADGAAWQLVELLTSDDRGERTRIGLVNAATRALSWSIGVDTLEGALFDQRRAVDLDGDGGDELVTTRWTGPPGSSRGTVEVVGIVGGELVDHGELRLGVRHDGVVCEGVATVIAGPAGTHRLAIVGAPHRGAPADADCPKLGRHVYQLDGKALVEIAP